MAKKIKFSLIMDNNVQVRTLEELRENFNMEKVIAYYSDGKLINWLKDRYYDVEAEKISRLNKNSNDFKKDLCEIIGVQFFDDELDIEAIELKNRRISYLKQFTDDKEILEQINSVAFNQDELADLLDEDVKKIYLCGDVFQIPLRKENISYIGVNKPKITISSNQDIDFSKLNISFKNIELNNVNNVRIVTQENKNVDTYIENEEDKLKLAQEYIDGVNGKKKNYVKAFTLFKEIAEDGNDLGLYKLGTCYEYGYGVEEDYKKAFECYTKASLYGLGEAYEKVGNCYYNGNGVEKNLEKAAANYRKALDEGIEDIKEKLNICEFEVCKVKANKGDAKAQCDLGSCYYSGDGVGKSYTKAVEWFKKSSMQGYGPATRNLGVCYQYGLGVSESKYQATSLYRQAISQGDSSAEVLLQVVTR